jgi:hypothetical protein
MEIPDFFSPPGKRGRESFELYSLRDRRKTLTPIPIAVDLSSGVTLRTVRASR